MAANAGSAVQGAGTLAQQLLRRRYLGIKGSNKVVGGLELQQVSTGPFAAPMHVHVAACKSHIYMITPRCMQVMCTLGLLSSMSCNKIALACIEHSHTQVMLSGPCQLHNLLPAAKATHWSPYTLHHCRACNDLQ